MKFTKYLPYLFLFFSVSSFSQENGGYWNMSAENLGIGYFIAFSKNDIKTYKNILHPEQIEIFSNENPELVKEYFETLKTIYKKPDSDSIRTAIIPIDKVDSFDKKKNTDKSKSALAFYTMTPDAKILIQATINGEKAIYASFMAAKHQGKWYILIPHKMSLLK